MVARVLVTIGILIYAVVVPILEINGTHVFNPEWTPHARLHDVWQLATNTSLGVFCLWLVWLKDVVRLPSIVATFITGGYLFAYAIRSLYDGADSGRAVVGLSLAVVGFSLVIILSVVAIVLNNRPKAAPSTSTYRA